MQVMKESEQRLERAVADRTGQLNSALANERAILSQYQRFGALISHEFRNPLGIIDSQVALMRKTSATEDSRLGGRLDVISGATQRLVKMFDQWLSDGQVRADIRPMKRSRILISDWLPQCLQENRMYAEQHVIEIRLDDSAMQLQADQELLDIALVNLLDNACKYSPAGSRIVIAATRKPGYIGISVIDQGSGIAPEHHERIFDDYVRIPSAGGARGTGLGLPFVKNIVNNHLGHISLTSASGEGSSFTLWFPEEPGPDTTQSASEAVPA